MEQIVAKQSRWVNCNSHSLIINHNNQRKLRCYLLLYNVHMNRKGKELILRGIKILMKLFF